MVTLEDKLPKEELPANVYFCSPNISEENEHVINFNELVPTTISKLTTTTTNMWDGLFFFYAL